MMTNAEYVALKAPQCPLCLSKKVEGDDEHEFSANEICVDMFCNDCDGRWTETYKLTGFAPRA